MANMNIPEGFGFVAGRGQDRARQVLDATEAAGFDRNSVLTRGGGYLAPIEAINAINGDNGEQAEIEEEGEAAKAAAVAESEKLNAEAEAKRVADEDEAKAKADAEAAATAEVDAEAAKTDEQKLADEAVETQPSKGGSKEEWSTWAAKYKGYDTSEDLGRNALIERFGA